MQNTSSSFPTHETNLKFTLNYYPNTIKLKPSFAKCELYKNFKEFEEKYTALPQVLQLEEDVIVLPKFVLL